MKTYILDVAIIALFCSAVHAIEVPKGAVVYTCRLGDYPDGGRAVIACQAEVVSVNGPIVSIRLWHDCANPEVKKYEIFQTNIDNLVTESGVYWEGGPGGPFVFCQDDVFNYDPVERFKGNLLTLPPIHDMRKDVESF